MASGAQVLSIYGGEPVGNANVSVRDAKRIAKKQRTKKKSDKRASTKGVRVQSSTPSAPARASLFPWVLLLFAVAGGCFGGYYMFQKFEMAQDEIAQAHATTDEVRQRAVEADHKIMALEAKLSKANGEFGAAGDIGAADAAKLNALTDDLKEMVKSESVELVPTDDGRINLRLDRTALFSSGQTRLTDNGRDVLEKIGVTLKSLTGSQIWVHSHLAEDADKSDRWDVSAERALAVVSFLQRESSVPANRLVAVAAGKDMSGSNPHIEFILAPERAGSIQN